MENTDSHPDAEFRLPPTDTEQAAPPHERKQSRPEFLVLCLGALGVVYGDIGTSPLYAFRECFHGPHSVPAAPANILGVLSLVFWSLIIVITIKYIGFVMLANNKGEGGILSLMSLVAPQMKHEDEQKNYRNWILTIVGLFGAALLYGDGMITPAISVLSAVEGLEIATPMFAHYVLPVTIAILFLLFLVQKWGTGGIGIIFGPVTLIWFACILLLGAYNVMQGPAVLQALNPWHAINFFVSNGTRGFLVLGSVFLVVTGGEALYADMGHFGRRPIKYIWFAVVLPALLFNYFGQGALLLNHPEHAENPFYLMTPTWALYPMVILATMATCIASQAVISGAFSLTSQAVQLGYSPRVRILHTSARHIGQIYIPQVNHALMVCTILLVLGFKTSSSLAAAYGIAVTTTMVITTFLLYFVARHLWGWSALKASLVMALFLVLDVAFFGANIIKVHDGGWFPLVVGGWVFTLMTTWRKGRMILNNRLKASALPDELFINSLIMDPPHRVSGTAVFMDRTPDMTPHALLHNIKHNKVLHERVILLTIVTEETPHVPEKERVLISPRGQGIYRLYVRYGFMESPDVPAVLKNTKLDGKDINPDQCSFFLGREKVLASDAPGMAVWREKLFAWMTQNATGAPYYFNLPPNRVVELGATIEL